MRQGLLSEEEWRARIDALRDAPVSSSIAGLAEHLREAVLARAGSRICVLFSGGIDSAIIAHVLVQHGLPVLGVTVGFHDGDAKEPEDIVEGRRVAGLLDIQHDTVLLSAGEAEALFARTVRMLGSDLVNVVNVGVGAVEVAAIERGLQCGCATFLGGLGSEEILAGYDRHEKALVHGGHAALHDECFRGLAAMWRRDMLREAAIGGALAPVATPFLDERLMRYALALPPELKIDPKRTFTGRARGDAPLERPFKKLALREAALLLGLPESVAFRPKRAAQYGSRMNNALTKLAKRRGFSHKNEYLASIASTVNVTGRKA